MADPTCYALWTFALPSGPCADWYSGTWSALAVAVAAGSYGWSEWRIRRKKIQDDKSVARIIAVKIIRLANESHTILRHFDLRGSCALDGERSPTTDWNKLHPLVGLTFNESLHLTDRESDLLLAIGASEILSDLTVAIDRLRTCILTMTEYKNKYEALQSTLPMPRSTDGAGFSYILSEEQLVLHQMHTLVLNELANGMYELISQCSAGAYGLLQTYNAAVKRHFNLKEFVTVELTPLGEAVFGGTTQKSDSDIEI